MNTVLIQGRDFKALAWGKCFDAEVYYFQTAKEFKQLLKATRGPKAAVFRYLNSQKSFLSDLKYTLYLTWTCALAGRRQLDIYWIMHNVDKETIDRYPLLTKIRRSMLLRTSASIFVTDDYIKQAFFPNEHRYVAVSFGPKEAGAIRSENRNRIADLRNNVDIVVLAVGARGQKYAHFRRLEFLERIAAEKGKSIGFIVPEFVNAQLKFCVQIDESNIDEVSIAHLVDFIYRVNNDVSMPYTLYAACTAKIPIVTAVDCFTYQLVKHYGIGFSDHEFADITTEQVASVKECMRRFLNGRSWRSLSEAIE